MNTLRIAALSTAIATANASPKNIVDLSATNNQPPTCMTHAEIEGVATNAAQYAMTKDSSGKWESYDEAWTVLSGCQSGLWQDSCDTTTTFDINAGTYVAPGVCFDKETFRPTYEGFEKGAKIENGNLWTCQDCTSTAADSEMSASEIADLLQYAISVAARLTGIAVEDTCPTS